MPDFTQDDIERLGKILLHDAISTSAWDDDAHAEEGPNMLVYSWAHPCFNCGTGTWVWMHNVLGNAAITRHCANDNLRGDMSSRLSGSVPISRIEEVTTGQGGTYLGFRCHSCGRVQGKYFLRVDLFARLLAGDNRVRKDWFYRDGDYVGLVAPQGEAWMLTRT